MQCRNSFLPGEFKKNLLKGLVREWVKVAQSCPTLCDPMDYTVPEILQARINTGVDNLSLFQGIFPTQGSNPGLPHCRWIISQLSHKGSPRILEWVVYPFSSGSSWPRNWTGVSCIAGRFFTNWAIRETPLKGLTSKQTTAVTFKVQFTELTTWD